MINILLEQVPIVLNYPTELNRVLDEQMMEIITKASNISSCWKLQHEN